MYAHTRKFPARSRRLARLARVLAAIVVLSAAATSMGLVRGATAASSNVTVSMDVASATNLVAGGCASGTAGSTDFGTIQPDSIVISSTACSVQFDSSNDTSLLRLLQSDGTGIAMHRLPDGSPDTSFGSGGTDIWSATTTDSAYGLRLQSDGKLIVLSGSGQLSRRLAGGGVDTSWNGTGVLPVTGAIQLRGLDVDSADRVIVGSNRDPGSGDKDVAVRRYDANGGSDGSFAGGAWTAIDVRPTADDAATDVVALDDGSVVVVGYSLLGGVRDQMALKLHADGTLDTDFGTSGTTVVANDTGTAIYPAGAVAANGKIAIASRTLNQARVIQLLADGTPDPGFGTSGVTDMPLAGGSEELRDVIYQPDGKIVAVGNHSGSGASEGTLVVRLTATGDPDDTFGGGDGIVDLQLAPAAEDTARSVLLQPDGKILVAGRIDVGAPELMQAYTMRLNTDGTLDTTYGTNGIATLTVTASDDDRIVDNDTMVWGSEGRLFIAGETKASGTDTFIHAIDAEALPDFNAGVNDWAQPNVAAFGGCLEQVANASAAGSWAVAGAGNCTTALPANWNAIAPTAGAAASIASTTTGTLNGQVDIRFGIRATLDQTPGTYVAPLTFELIAPAV